MCLSNDTCVKRQWTELKRVLWEASSEHGDICYSLQAVFSWFTSYGVVSPASPLPLPVWSFTNALQQSCFTGLWLRGDFTRRRAKHKYLGRYFEPGKWCKVESLLVSVLLGRWIVCAPWELFQGIRLLQEQKEVWHWWMLPADGMVCTGVCYLMPDLRDILHFERILWCFQWYRY